ncbi:MAG: glycosyltransferase family 4 protein [Aquaticitalea sp.]
MKIGLVLPTVPGYSETFFRSKIIGLEQSGHNVTIFCSHYTENSNKFKVILLPKHYKNQFIQVMMMLWEYFKLIFHLKTVKRYVVLERVDKTSWSRILKRVYNNAPILKEKLDWLHFGFGTLVMDCQNVAKAKQTKMAISFRGFDIGIYPIKNPNCYLKTWEVVDKIHVISDDIKDLLYKNGFQDQASVVKITPAIDSDFFTPNTLRMDDDSVKIITVARLHWKKGLDYTLEALFLLKQKGIKFEYRIIGSGPAEEALKFAVYQLKLQKEVIFLGKLKPEEVKVQLGMSKVYIQYSVQEGFCNAVLEAQAMGLLCMVSNAEGLAENVLDQVTGFVVQKRNPMELAIAIEKLLYLPSNQKLDIEEAAIKRIHEKFNLENQKMSFIDFYTVS